MTSNESRRIRPLNSNGVARGVDGCVEDEANMMEVAGESRAGEQLDAEIAGEQAAVEDSEETRRPRICKRPLAPTKEMVEEHNRTHAEYRDWCPDCRAGKSTGLHHRRGDPSEEKLGVTVSIDYAFRQGDEREEGLIPILVAYDNVKCSIWALEVEEKGISNSSVAVSWLIEKLDASGYHGVDIALKSDNEPSILALKDAVALARGCGTPLIESPVRESKGNAHVERAIRSWRDQFRTLRHYTERRFGQPIPKEHALTSWLVSWSAEVLNRFKVRASGRTAFEMATLHKVRHKVVAFGEKVYFQHTYIGKDDDRKDVGVFVGMMDRSPTYLIANSNGIFGSPNIAAFPDENAFDPELALSIAVSQHQYLDKGVMKPPGQPATAVPMRHNPEAEPVVTTHGGYVPRRTRITKADLIMHGFTPECPACISANLDDGLRRGGHTEACRLRMENLMEDERLQRTEARIGAWVSGEEKTAGEAPGENSCDSPVAAAVMESEDAATPVIGSEDVTMAEEPATSLPTTPLADAPIAKRGVRFRTPERTPAVKRPTDVGGGPETIRRRLDDTMDDADTGADSPLGQWYNDNNADPEVDMAGDSLVADADEDITIDSLFDSLNTLTGKSLRRW